MSYGGSTQSGIQPCRDSPNILIYSDPQSGEKYGYSFDGWNSTKTVFFYSGEGRIGDQKLTKGNKAIAEHLLAGRALHIMISHSFVPGTKTRRHEYIGEFRIDLEDPFHLERGPDERGSERDVYVFHLIPVGVTRKHDSHSRRTPTPRQATPKRGGATRPKVPAPRETPARTPRREVVDTDQVTRRTRASMPQKSQNHVPHIAPPRTPKPAKTPPIKPRPTSMPLVQPGSESNSNGKWIAAVILAFALALIIGIMIGSS